MLKLPRQDFLAKPGTSLRFRTKVWTGTFYLPCITAYLGLILQKWWWGRETYSKRVTQNSIKGPFTKLGAELKETSRAVKALGLATQESQGQAQEKKH